MAKHVITVTRTRGTYSIDVDGKTVAGPQRERKSRVLIEAEVRIAAPKRRRSTSEDE